MQLLTRLQLQFVIFFLYCHFIFPLHSSQYPRWYGSYPGRSVLLEILLVFCYCSFSGGFTMEHGYTTSVHRESFGFQACSFTAYCVIVTLFPLDNQNCHADNIYTSSVWGIQSGQVSVSTFRSMKPLLCHLEVSLFWKLRLLIKRHPKFWGWKATKIEWVIAYHWIHSHCHSWVHRLVHPRYCWLKSCIPPTGHDLAP